MHFVTLRAPIAARRLYIGAGDVSVAHEVACACEPPAGFLGSHSGMGNPLAYQETLRRWMELD